jgi:hypothetical protein
VAIVVAFHICFILVVDTAFGAVAVTDILCLLITCMQIILRVCPSQIVLDVIFILTIIICIVLWLTNVADGSVKMICQ